MSVEFRPALFVGLLTFLLATLVGAQFGLSIREFLAQILPFAPLLVTFPDGCLQLPAPLIKLRFQTDRAAAQHGHTPLQHRQRD